MTDFERGVWAGIAIMAVLHVPCRLAADALCARWKRQARP